MNINADDLNRFIQCNGFRLMQPSMPVDSERDTTAQDEGVAAHYMALAVFRGEFEDTAQLVDRKAPNGVYMTAEMAEHVDQFLNLINSRQYVDHGMEVVTSFAGVDGRADHIGLTIDNILVVDDFKYGWGIVEPERNWTLVSHMVGFYKKLKERPSGFELNINQPRPYHRDGPTRTWRLTYDEYVNVYTELRTALDAPSDRLTTGPNCYKCKAMATCPAYNAATMNALDASEMAFDDTVTDPVLASSLDLLNRASVIIKQKLEAFEELTKYRLRSGAAIGDYALEPSVGNRAWNDGMSPQMLHMLTGIDLSKPGVVTPAQAIKLGVSDEVVKSLTSRPSRGVKLVRESLDKRAARLLRS